MPDVLQRPLSADALRVIAEAAAGIPDGQLGYIVEIDGRLRFTSDQPADGWYLTITGAPASSVARELAPTPFGVDLLIGMPPAAPEVLDTRSVVPLRDEYDAFFWSRAAVEKFVLPYYFRLYKTEGVQKIEASLTEQPFLGVAHGPRSPSVTLDSKGRPTYPFFTLDHGGIAAVGVKALAPDARFRPLGDLAY